MTVGVSVWRGFIMTKSGDPDFVIIIVVGVSARILVCSQLSVLNHLPEFT